MNSQNLEDKFQYCSFCKTPKENVLTLIAGNDACICPNCALGVHRLLVEKTDINKVMKTDHSLGIGKSISSVTMVITLLALIMAVLFFFFR
jgi:hypothetical protein